MWLAVAPLMMWSTEPVRGTALHKIATVYLLLNISSISKSHTSICLCHFMSSRRLAGWSLELEFIKILISSDAVAGHILLGSL